MEQVTSLAERMHWDWVHFRPAQTEQGWRTPVSGTLGKGYPDLLLCKAGRLLFRELKSDTGRISDEQRAVLDTLREAGADACVWRPRDWDEVVEVLCG